MTTMMTRKETRDLELAMYRAAEKAGFAHILRRCQAEITSTGLVHPEEELYADIDSDADIASMREDYRIIDRAQKWVDATLARKTGKKAA
jgi:hypothetical protein